MEDQDKNFPSVRTVRDRFERIASKRSQTISVSSFTKWKNQHQGTTIGHQFFKNVKTEFQESNGNNVTTVSLKTQSNFHNLSKSLGNLDGCATPQTKKFTGEDKEKNITNTNTKSFAHMKAYFENINKQSQSTSVSFKKFHSLDRRTVVSPMKSESFAKESAFRKNVVNNENKITEKTNSKHSVVVKTKKTEFDKIGGENLNSAGKAWSLVTGFEKVPVETSEKYLTFGVENTKKTMIHFEEEEQETREKNNDDEEQIDKNKLTKADISDKAKQINYNRSYSVPKILKKSETNIVRKGSDRLALIKRQLSVSKTTQDSNQKTYQKLNDDHTFQKLEGTTDQGPEFEDLMTASMALNLALDGNVKNFSISANDKNYHPLDDIVLKVEMNNGIKEQYAMQLKYVNSKKLLRIDHLIPHRKGKNIQNEDHKGNFNVLKYFRAYQNSEFLRSSAMILVTNRSFQITEEYNKMFIEDGKDVIELRITECLPKLKALFFRNAEGRICKCYQFEIINTDRCSNRVKLEEYQHFFEHFFLQTNMISVQEFEENIHSIIKNNLSVRDKVFEDYKTFIRRWSLKNGRKSKLDKTYIQIMMSVILVEPFVKFLSRDDDVSSSCNENLNLLKNLFTKFKILTFSESNLNKILKLWQSADKLPDIDTLLEETQNYNLIRHKVQNVTDLNEQEFTFLMWFFGKAPLIVEAHQDVKKAVDLLSNKQFSFTIIESDQNFEDHTLRNLDSLRDNHYEFYQEILEKFYCSIQGEKISLNKLIDRTDKNLAKMLTLDELICCADNSLKLGRANVSLPPSYIERQLSKAIINVEFLNSVDERNCLLISNFTANDEISNVIKDFDIVDIELLTLKNRQILNVLRPTVTKVKRIYVTENECNQEIFDHFCSRVPGNKYFHFRLFDSKLEWVQSKNCDVSQLKEYALGGYYVPESELLQYENDNNINIICGEPGIGKTSLMKSIINNVNSSNYWTILILVKDHSIHFRYNNDSDEEKFEKYILDQTCKEMSKFESQLLELFMKKRFIRFIWDGLDELSPKNFVTVLKIIDKFLSKGYKQWITSRFSYRDQLENRYKVVAKKIEKFQKNEQETYIKNRLKNHSVKSFPMLFSTNRKNVLKHDFLEVPLQIYMLTELLLQDPSKYDYLFDKMFTMPDLYQYFIDIKFDMYYKKLGYDPNNAANEKKNHQDKSERIENYEKVAALVLFEDLLSYDEISEAKKFLNKIQNNQDDYGIITSVSDENKAEFFHNSVAEYFAISYIVKNDDYISGAGKYISDNSNLRYFFDFMVSDNCRAHTAILRKDYDFFKTCSDEELLKKDKAGRSVLHLASCYGTKYPPVRTENDKDVYTVDDRVVYWQELKPESLDYLDIVVMLMTKCDPDESDKFSKNCFSYALEHNCFLLFLTFCVKLQRNFIDFEEYLGTILYYSVRFDCYEVFDLLEEIPFFKSKHFDKSLLFLAVFYNSAKSLENMLSKVKNNELYKKVVNIPLEPLVEKAFDNRNYSVLKVLVNHGIEMQNENPEKSGSFQNHRKRSFHSLGVQLEGIHKSHSFKIVRSKFIE